MASGSSRALAAIWLILLGLVAAMAAAGISPEIDTHTTSFDAQRKLQGASIFPLAASLPISPFAGAGGSITLPFHFKGIPGTPSPPSPKRYYKVNCDNLRPTFVVIPGISGSQLDATQTGGVANCPAFSSPRQVYADLTWMKNLQCFAHMMSVGYDASSNRYSNSSGTQMWAWEAGWPDGTDMTITRNYYAGLWTHLETKYGYKRGVDLFAAPYDWRMDFDAMNQIGQFDQMAARIAAAVDQNCGQKAIILSHSMGVNVALRLLQEPRFATWRKQHVRGHIMVGGTLSGSGAAAWQTKLSGVLDPFPGFTNIATPATWAQLPTFPLEAAVYQFTLGMPSFAAVLPRNEPLGADQVVVKTPSRSYTRGEQKQLLLDMGDDQSALLLEKVAAQNAALLGGPVPGIESFCIYGISQPTPLTLEYGENIRRRQVMRRPYNIIKGPGDGTVDIKTLRLCYKIVSAPDNVVEVSDPRVDHSAVTREPAGLAALDTIFAKLGMRMGTPAAAAQPVSGPVSNRASG